jgi:hypothetical protein
MQFSSVLLCEFGFSTLANTECEKQSMGCVENGIRVSLSRLHPGINEIVEKEVGRGGSSSVTLTLWFPNDGAHTDEEALNFLGKLYSKIEMITILTLSEMDCLISCTAFRNVSSEDTVTWMGLS